MYVLFDHLTALIAASAVLLIFVVLQFRGWQSASDAAVNHMMYSELLGIKQYLQTDVENIRSESQTDTAIDRGTFTGGAYSCQITTSGGVTTTFTFPTLADPDGDYDLADPEDAQVTLITYQLVDTGSKIQLPQGDSYSTVPVYRLNRVIDGVVTGGSRANITHFLVELSSRGSTTFSSSSGPCPANLEKVRFEFKIATDYNTTAADGQNTSNPINISRYGTTVTLANWE